MIDDFAPASNLILSRRTPLLLSERLQAAKLASRQNDLRKRLVESLASSRFRVPSSPINILKTWNFELGTGSVPRHPLRQVFPTRIYIHNFQIPAILNPENATSIGARS